MPLHLRGSSGICRGDPSIRAESMETVTWSLREFLLWRELASATLRLEKCLNRRDGSGRKERNEGTRMPCIVQLDVMAQKYSGICWRLV